MHAPVNRWTAILTLVLCCASPLSAADTNGDGLESILVPFAFTSADFAGAFGTRWTGRIWLHNSRSSAIHLLRNFACPGTCGQYGAGYTGELLLTWMIPDRSLGLLLSPSVEDAASLTLSSRLWELSRHGQPRGVEVPIVREGSFLSRPTTFVAVPVGADVRVALRGYNPWHRVRMRDGAETLIVDVRTQDGILIGTATLHPRWHISMPEALLTPGYDAVLDLATVIPQLDEHATVNITVTPYPPMREYYAFVAVTDDDTQTVSIITAQ